MLVNQGEMTPLCMRLMSKRERISTAPETWKHSRSTTRVPNEHPIAECKTEGRTRIQRERRKGGGSKSPHTYTKQAPIPNTVAVTDNVRPDTPRSFPDLPYTVTRVHEHKSTDMCVQNTKITVRTSTQRSALRSIRPMRAVGAARQVHHITVNECSPGALKAP